MEQIQSRLYFQQLCALVEEYFGEKIRIEIRSSDTATENSMDRKNRELHEREEQIRKSIAQHPLIQEARALFGGEMGPIELKPPLKQEGANVSP